MHTIGEGLFQRGQHVDARQHILSLMRDPFDAVGLVLARIHQPQVTKAEILHGAHDVRNIDEILRLVEHDDNHPTSSSMPNLPGSCLSPRSHTQPPPPLQTSWPTRRNRPGSISLTMRSKRTRLPACAYTPVGQGMAPGEFQQLLYSLRSGVNYVKVHTSKHPGGEIRG